MGPGASLKRQKTILRKDSIIEEPQVAVTLTGALGAPKLPPEPIVPAATITEAENATSSVTHEIKVQDVDSSDLKRDASPMAKRNSSSHAVTTTNVRNTELSVVSEENGTKAGRKACDMKIVVQGGVTSHLSDNMDDPTLMPPKLGGDGSRYSINTHKDKNHNALQSDQSLEHHRQHIHEERVIDESPSITVSQARSKLVNSGEGTLVSGDQVTLNSAKSQHKLIEEAKLENEGFEAANETFGPLPEARESTTTLLTH